LFISELVVISIREIANTDHIIEVNHRFLTENNKTNRENETWREVIDRRTGNHVAEEMLAHNFAGVKYALNFAAAECNL
jgi:hypothetical protein